MPILVCLGITKDLKGNSHASFPIKWPSTRRTIWINETTVVCGCHVYRIPKMSEGGVGGFQGSTQKLPNIPETVALGRNLKSHKTVDVRTGLAALLQACVKAIFNQRPLLPSALENVQVPAKPTLQLSCFKTALIRTTYLFYSIHFRGRLKHATLTVFCLPTLHYSVFSSATLDKSNGKRKSQY